MTGRMEKRIEKRSFCLYKIKLIQIVKIEQFITTFCEYGDFTSERKMSMSMSGVPEFKVIIMGDSAVGKTSIVACLNSLPFSGEKDATIGASFLTKTVETGHGEVILSVWDTAGQERYRSLIPTYSRGAHAAVLVYDVTSETSFQRVEAWREELGRFCPSDLPVWVVAAKCDLDVIVPHEQAERYAQDHGFTFAKTSSKLNEGVTELFGAIAEMLASRQSYFSVKKHDRGVDLLKTDRDKKCC